MRKPWAFICAKENAKSRDLREYCRRVYLAGYVPVCPKLQDGDYLNLDLPEERSDFANIVRDKILRCSMLVACDGRYDATMNAQIGLAQKYNRIVTTLDGLEDAVPIPDDDGLLY